jgi:hypothetical protein
MKKSCLFGFTLLSLIYPAILAAGLRAPERGFVSRRPAENWQEALISGNGKIGALVMSEPQDEIIIFSHERLFMPWYKILPLVDLKPHMNKIRELIEKGRYEDAARLGVEISDRHGYNVESVHYGMRWPDPFVPAFDLSVKMGGGEISEYGRSLDWQTGVAKVQWADDKGAFIRRLFVSRADGVAVLSIIGGHGAKVDCLLSLTTRPGEDEQNEDDEDEEDENEEDEGGLFEEGIKEIVIEAEGPWMSYQGSFKKAYHSSIEGYEGLAKVVTDGGTVKTENKSIKVSGAKEVVVLVWLDVLYDLSKSKLSEQKARLDRLKADFDHLLKKHEKIHGEIFNRMRLDLGGSEKDRSLPVEKLFAKTKLGRLNKALLEKQFDACRYAVLSSTGDWPPALQGIWTGTWRPNWQGDFTIDGNIQSAIASMLMANMPECMEAYINYTELFLPHFRENARQIYGYRGILMPSRTSVHGYLNHFSYDFMWLYWTASAPWAAHYFYDYYLYTGDREFLRDRAVPFMKEAVLFYEDFLYEGDDGKYVFNPSYSPENTPRNSDSQICINATMDIGFAKELFTNLIAAYEELGIEEEGIRRWKKMLTKMPDYMINEDGAVREWTTEKLEDNYRHRHASHLCHLADWLPEDIANDPKLQEAFRTAIEMKMRPRRKEMGGVMAFGIVQLGQAATSLGDAELSYECVDMIANRFWRATNMTPTHDPGRIFNMDTAGGLPAVIIKMLVISEVGGIDLLRALPKEWPSGTIEGVLCRGQIEIKKLSWDDKQIDVRFVSEIPQNVKISVPGSFKQAQIRESNSDMVESLAKKGKCVVAVPPGELVGIHFVR